jgi:hypothetical protein
MNPKAFDLQNKTSLDTISDSVGTGSILDRKLHIKTNKERPFVRTRIEFTWAFGK